MKRAVTIVSALLIASAMAGAASAEPKSLGKVTLDTEVDAGINYGSGIPNGEWIVAEKQGVEIGLRATDRTDGLLDVTGAKGNRVAVYEASTGFDAGTDRAEWNYEFHVDVSRATGRAEGTTLEDYDLALYQDLTQQSLYGTLGSDPVSLPMPGVCDALTDTLCQQSWNPTFGNDDFDPTVAGTYHLRLVLTPATFNGPPIAVQMQVNVS